MNDWQWLSTSPEMTRQFGFLLGGLLAPGAVVALDGDLGSGKTCLTQGLAHGIGVPDSEPVTSPTYTLMNHYRGRFDLYHFDFYRLTAVDELDDLGFDEYLSRQGVVIYEWSQRFAPLEVDALQLSLEWTAENARKISLSATGTSSEQLLESVRQLWLAQEVS